MCTLTYTPHRHDALTDVGHGDIEFHTVEAPVEGFHWCGGAQLPKPEYDALNLLWRTGLIRRLPATVRDRADHSRRVALTPTGHDALTEWGGRAAA
ncbi:hypothetical protein [Actinopolyspora halophila]|uniref:hypothetical protein n=1 Tax=Actinopolyspora halophila TaxID=1850 RepID=UPI000371F64A|nr:hypothetical protein [Actinopolyspora halophila]